MKIFRNKKDGKLYLIYKVSPPKVLGKWYEAEPYNHSGIKIKFSDEKDIEKKFVLVSEK